MKDISFQEKELTILRESVDEATAILGKKLARSDDIKILINILENFIIAKKCLCYGGTAINNILPHQDRFYNKNIEIPDYDFFSSNALEDAKELADIYFKEGYTEVEAKAGIHTGTYKVFVNFIPIADITYLDKSIFNNLMKKAIKVNSINYCPPDFLRMSMYLELSRPMGDVSRWEKVLKRLILLNKHFPLKGLNCNKTDFIREYVGPNSSTDNIYNIVRKSIINQGLVFFGGYATSLYGKYMPNREKKQLSKYPDFDILSEDAKRSANIIREQLIYEGFRNIEVIKKQSIDDLITEHYEIIIKHKTKIDVLCYVYNSNSCHSYNIIHINGETLRVATIDTMLSFYLIFIYVNRGYYDINRLLCMSEYLFKVQLKNRLEQKGLLKRFSINCYGKHSTMEDIRSNKSKKYKELRAKNLRHGNKEYDKYFLRYIPDDNISYKCKKQTNNTKNSVTYGVTKKIKNKKIKNKK
tara:strand:- start:1722 stop:3131 length:1410 start_codon:yes stop_codon:yes gene_type:complete